MLWRRLRGLNSIQKTHNFPSHSPRLGLLWSLWNSRLLLSCVVQLLLRYVLVNVVRAPIGNSPGRWTDCGVWKGAPVQRPREEIVICKRNLRFCEPQRHWTTKLIRPPSPPKFSSVQLWCNYYGSAASAVQFQLCTVKFAPGSSSMFRCSAAESSEKNEWEGGEKECNDLQFESDLPFLKFNCFLAADSTQLNSTNWS